MAPSKTNTSNGTKTETPAQKIARDLSAVKDGSKFSDGTGAGFESALSPVAGLAKQYGTTAESLDNIVRKLAEAETAMRLTVLRSDGTPDLAGTSDLWRSVLSAEVVSIYRAAMGEDRANKLRSAITSMRNRNGLNHANAAAYAVATVNGLGAKKVTREIDGKKVTQAVSAIVAEAKPGDPIPDVVREAMSKVYAAQKDTNGKRAKGFETVPACFGGPSKQPKTETPPDTTPSGTESLWANLRTAVGTKSASNATAEQLVRLATTVADTYLGKPEAKPTTDLVTDRAETAKYLAQAAAILKHLAAAMIDPDDTNTAKEAIAPHRIAG